MENSASMLNTQVNINFGGKTFNMTTLVGKLGIWRSGDLTPENDLVSHCLRRDGCWEPYQTEVTIELLKKLRARIFIDVGAHLGYYSLIAASYGWEVKSFEMNSMYYSMFLQNINECSFGGNLTTNLSRVGTQTKLDDVISGKLIGLIKIDVEGSEPEVIKSLVVSLEKQLIGAIIIEISPKYLDFEILQEMIENIQKHGYNVFDLGLSPQRRLQNNTNHLENLKPFEMINLRNISQTNLLFMLPNV